MTKNGSGLDSQAALARRGPERDESNMLRSESDLGIVGFIHMIDADESAQTKSLVFAGGRDHAGLRGSFNDGAERSFVDRLL